MTINGRRDFRFNGRKYHVQNTRKHDRQSENDKYYLCEVDQNGYYHCLYNICGWDLVKFGTIKEAQRYVRDWDFTLKTL